MKAKTFECSMLLEKALKRQEWNAATLSRNASVPSALISDFEEHGDFRMTSDNWMIDQLLQFLKSERKKYVEIALMDYSDDELLLEIKNRLIAG